MPTVTRPDPRGRQLLMAMGSRPVSVRQLQDRLDRPQRGALTWNRHQVRVRLEHFTTLGWVQRSRGRLPWTVRYSLTAAGRDYAQVLRAEAATVTQGARP